MESVQDLRARIAKIATEIDLQKELLKKLERDKSLVQRQLNAVLDPVARLPLEISSEILLRSAGPWPNYSLIHPPSPRCGPILLLNICNGWTNIALSTPAIWAAIHLIFPYSQGLKKILPIWLERACNRPLTVLLKGNLDEDVLAIIWKHGQQLKHLEIRAADDSHGDGAVYDEDSDDDESEVMKLWVRTAPGPLPLLETLKIHGAYRGIWRFSGPHLYQLLRLAPNLTECFFQRMKLTDFGPAAEELVLPRLRRLMFGELGVGRYTDESSYLLQSLSLPVLETLSLSIHSNSGGLDSLSEFLKLSSPSLRELVLWDLVSEYGIDFTQLTECLHLMPALRRFETSRCRPHMLEQLFAALAEFPFLLPNLRTLVLHLFPPEGSDISDSFWVTLTRALTTRRTQLQSVHIVVPYELPASKLPTSDIIATFRELGVGGMQVFIGPDLDRQGTMYVHIGSVDRSWVHLYTLVKSL